VIARDHFESGASVVGELHTMPVARQERRDELPVRFDVVDNQDPPD